MDVTEPRARFRSSRQYEGEWVVYETFADRCSCPGFNHRGECQHLKAVSRFDHWGLEIPEGILPPPVAWKVEDE